MDMVVQVENSGPVLAKVDELEANRQAVSTEISRIDQERQASQALAGITPEQVQGYCKIWPINWQTPLGTG
ncbi:MAG: hypothetical protein JMN25_04660 [gamma proteobacterium endosymbiont of Lamellibrachia anaximandri]|nr:hypothetical protein [gamma proteobacterium endosymbiont of Lamellibrachia anaximandri]